MPFDIQPVSKIPDVLRINTQVFPDPRGAVLEFYDRKAFSRSGITDGIELGITSICNEGTLRGLHLQAAPHHQGKIIQCVAGEVFDVVVDLRPRSKTFGHNVTMTLSDRDYQALFAPRGFAHGFYVTRGPAVVHYLVDHPYVPAAETGVRWDDPELRIPWPLNGRPIVSAKDEALPNLHAYRQRLMA